MSARSRTERRAHWVPDALATKCTSCAEPFTLTRRKHHCRRCGFVFCAPCVARNIFLHSPNPELNYKSAVRVCSKCYDAERKVRDAPSIAVDPVRTIDVKGPPPKPAMSGQTVKASTSAPAPVVYDTIPVLNDIPDELRDNVWFFSNIDRKTAENILELKGVNGSFIVRPSSQKGDDGFVISCIKGSTINHYLLHCVKAIDGSLRYIVDSNRDKHMLFMSIAEAAKELRLTPLVIDDESDDESTSYTSSIPDIDAESPRPKLDSVTEAKHVAALVEMGFDPQKSKTSLTRARGSLRGAAEMLLAEQKRH